MPLRVISKCLSRSIPFESLASIFSHVAALIPCRSVAESLLVLSVHSGDATTVPLALHSSRCARPLLPSSMLSVTSDIVLVSMSTDTHPINSPVWRS